MKKKIIDYLIDYACPIISDNRLWNFSDCTSLIPRFRDVKDFKTDIFFLEQERQLS